MDLYPAIDIRNGRVVRLSQGEATRQTVYGDDPVAVAERFVDAGRGLDPRRGSRPRVRHRRQHRARRRIVAAVGGRVRMQLGGGLRSARPVRRGAGAGRRPGGDRHLRRDRSGVRAGRARRGGRGQDRRRDRRAGRPGRGARVDRDVDAHAPRRWPASRGRRSRDGHLHRRLVATACSRGPDIEGARRLQAAGAARDRERRRVEPRRSRAACEAGLAGRDRRAGAVRGAVRPGRGAGGRGGSRPMR